MDLFQFLFGSLFQALNGSEVSGQDLRRALAHMTNADPKQQSREFQGATRVDFLHEILGGFRTHSFEILQLVFAQTIKVRHIMNEVLLDQLVHQSLTEAIDLHCLPARPVKKGLFQFGGTSLRQTSTDGFPLLSKYFSTTNWTARRHRERDTVLGLLDNTHDLRNHVAASLQ